MLLLLIVWAIGVSGSFFTPEWTRALMAVKLEFIGDMLAALLGVVTPFCSCSAVPPFIGFMEAGVPLGVTFAFLVSTPMVNEIAPVLLFGLFGWRSAWRGRGVFCGIISRAWRCHPLTGPQKKRNNCFSRVRQAVEGVIGTLKCRHGLERCRYLGLRLNHHHLLLKGIRHNLKKMLGLQGAN